ncbi:TnsA endonuclease N-terminal domain-containing protein [Neptuniibacter sp.]|uniref:TnsA endonuclease N-terminal domain-containing protein n=1 Tax=Neptuniibacter sp. TaxID=1962643 RepID=UPI0026380E0B|nr:TnsA endonuclease N-terminal domain-containing protein [Neptuniibacter sp.]MCP4597951.1 hypothetical protein [Neptuniibacter sp.]
MTVRGRFRSSKRRPSIAWESLLERSACYRFEFSPAVIAFYEQPDPIKFYFQGKLSRYTPDFRLHLNNGETWFVEVKPLKHLQRPDLFQKFLTISDEYRNQGYGFIVITDEELNHFDLESNLTHIHYYRLRELSDLTIRQARNWVLQTDSPTLGKMHEYFGDMTTAFVLISQQYICLDLTSPFSSGSNLYLPEEDHHATLLFSYRTAPAFELCNL